jgi:hypothetical protein
MRFEYENQKMTAISKAETLNKPECIPPTRENTKTSIDVERMFNSHVWKLEKAESQYGEKGVFIRMNCTRCGAKKVAILSEDYD